MASKEVAGHPGVYVTNTGAVWSKRSGRLVRLHPAPDAEGYLHVCLSDGGRRRDVAVHRLVAQEWCPGWHPSLEVHHIDGDPSNNEACNLACLTPLEHSKVHHIWVDEAKMRRERERANELIAASRPPVKGEPAIRGMLRAIEDARKGLKRRGISL